MTDDNVREGTSGDDTLRGGGDSDVIYGGEGDDLLYGGGGVDTVYGGAGDDWVYGGGSEDKIYGDAGDDTLMGDAGEDTIYGGEGVDFVVAGSGDDMVYGGSGDDYRLYGGLGDDAVYGGAGADTLRGDEGDDYIEGGAGDDSMAGGEGADTFVFGPAHGDDTITDFDADENDTIDISAFGDTITWDLLKAQFSEVTDEQGDVTGVQVDLSDWGGGTLTINGVVTADLTAGMFNLDDGSGSTSTTADITFHIGTLGDDTLTGGEGNDAIVGGVGDDTISGGDGDDYIIAGADDDTITGGAGEDTFVYMVGDGDDTITDFTDGEDVINLSGMADVTGFEDLTITADGTAAVIDLTDKGGGKIRLENFDVDDLDATDFQFYEPPVDTASDGI